MESEIVQILLGLNAILLAIIAWGGKWGISKICENIAAKVDKEDCAKTHKAVDKETGEVWDRINHHQHNGGGRVVIP